MTSDNVLLTIILFLVVVNVFTLCYTLYRVDYLISKSNVSDEELLFLISERFAEVHSFNETSYDCNNYSGDYAIVMNLLDYETYKFDNYTSLHSYNLVAVEPQRGELKEVGVSYE